jgi:hypothetical protein
MNLEIDRNERNYKLWEKLPGALTWAVFIVPIITSIYYPAVIASIIIVYALYWLVKAILMSYYLVIGYYQYRTSVKINWLEKCKLLSKSNNSTNWQDIYHLAIIATYKEDIQTLRYTIDAILNSNYPLDKIILNLGFEERDYDNAKKISDQLAKEYANKFKKFIITFHPKDIPGEVPGKGTNLIFACKESLKYIDSLKIDHNKVLVASFDSDNRVHKEYFASVTYNHLINNDGVHRVYQPLSMYFNNIWHVPLAIRSISIGSSFWQMIESTRPYRMRNFSAHSQSLSDLIATNFWSAKSIVEDGHQYWRSYLAFNGNYKVVPLHIPVYQDAVLSNKGYLATFHEQYIQKRRWAWGCSDIPFVITKILFNNKIPFFDRWVQFFRLLEGHFSWSTTSIILGVVGWMPKYMNSHFHETVIAYNFPFIYSRILTLAMAGLVVTLVISQLMLPPKPKKGLTWSVLLEWVLSPFLLPISNIIFSSLPAIESQTRLMTGNYLDFRVTVKAVTPANPK